MNKEEIQEYLEKNSNPIRKSDVETSLALLERFGYSLQQILGCGGQGIVFRAKTKFLDESVTIKIQQVKDYSKSYMEARFYKKCKRSKYFPKFYKHFYDESSKLCYLIQQYYQKGDLKNYLKNNPLLSEQEKMILFIKILQGISELHKFGIIHANLKPENILLSDQNQPLLTNFETSCEKKEFNSLQTISIYTMAYCAPEQLQLQVVMESDFYSAGAILLQLLGVSEAQLIQIQKGKIPSREQFQNKKLYDIALSMMDIEPKQRSTAEQVILQLQSLISQDTQQNKLPFLFDIEKQSLNTEGEIDKTVQLQQKQLSLELSRSCSNPSEITILKTQTSSVIIQKPFIVNQKRGVCEEINDNYSNGNTKYRGIFKNGKPHGQLIQFYEDGILQENGLYRDGREDGEVQKFYQNGNLKSRGLYENGKYHGQVIQYFENENVKIDGMYSQGEKHGEVREYYEDNNIKCRGLYKNGKKHGQYQEYNNEGGLIKEGIYSNGLENGQVILYYDNGNKKFEGNYKKGKCHGQIQRFDEEGNQTASEFYQDGKLAQNNEKARCIVF